MLDRGHSAVRGWPAHILNMAPRRLEESTLVRHHAVLTVGLILTTAVTAVAGNGNAFGHFKSTTTSTTRPSTTTTSSTVTTATTSSTTTSTTVLATTTTSTTLGSSCLDGGGPLITLAGTLSTPYTNNGLLDGTRL